MIGITEKIGRRRTVAAMLLIGIIVFSAVYALFQTKSGFAVLTSPPPGIPGPYYVTAEAKIYGPVVDLSAIKSKTGGTNASDNTYVQWGIDPFYRIYVDNTLQEVYYGQMVEVMDQISWRPGDWQTRASVNALENNMAATYDSLVNTGAIDPTSVLGNLNYFGNLPGTYIAIFLGINYQVVTYSLNTSSSQWYAMEAGGCCYAGQMADVSLVVAMNSTIALNASLPFVWFEQYRSKSLNVTGALAGKLNWEITINTPYQYSYESVTIYLKDLSVPPETTIPTSAYRVYNVTDSPGTGFVSKHVSPSSPVIGSTISIAVRFDPPAASKTNITDMYPNTFTWAGGQVKLQKFRLGVGLVATAFVSVTPTPEGSNMKFTIYYNQATDILESLLSDEYVHVSYTLTVPSTSGEYTMPSASMTYLIPLPQT